MPPHYIPLHTLRTACRYASRGDRARHACVLSDTHRASHGVLIFL